MRVNGPRTLLGYESFSRASWLRSRGHGMQPYGVLSRRRAYDGGGQSLRADWCWPRACMRGTTLRQVQMAWSGRKATSLATWA